MALFPVRIKLELLLRGRNITLFLRKMIVLSLYNSFLLYDRNVNNLKHFFVDFRLNAQTCKFLAKSK